MSLVPVNRNTGRKRETSEAERNRQRQQKEKADWHRRNPDSKWNGR